jgi:hypothetical protein
MGKNEICERCNGKGYGRCVCENAPSSCTVDSIVGCLTEILREAHRCPDDSLVDIANDAFMSHGVSLLAAWTDDDSDPIMVAPNPVVLLPPAPFGKEQPVVGGPNV